MPPYPPRSSTSISPPPPSTSSSDSTDTNSSNIPSTSPPAPSESITQTTPTIATSSTITSLGFTTGTTSPSSAAVSTVTTNTSKVNDGAIAGGVIGGTVFLACLILGILLFCRARRRKHIAPSSEFAETIKRGEMPVLRLDSGVEIIPPAPHHIPLPLRQNSYPSQTMSDMKFPDGMMWSEAQSARYSLQKPLQPLRFPVHQDSDDSMRQLAPMGSSSENSQECWSHEPLTENIEPHKEFVSQSPPSSADPSFLPLMQNTYPMEHSRAMETVENAYVDLWELSVAPSAQSRSTSTRRNGNVQSLPPLVPVRRSVDAHALPPLVPVRRSVDIGRRGSNL